jgi:hypothetical protein
MPEKEQILERVQYIVDQLRIPRGSHVLRFKQLRGDAEAYVCPLKHMPTSFASFSEEEKRGIKSIQIEDLPFSSDRIHVAECRSPKPESMKTRLGSGAYGSVFKGRLASTEHSSYFF